NVGQEIRNQLNAEAEAVQIILTRIDNDIYSTVDACPNACEMWKAIERLKQGESINVQDLETNLFWEFGKFTKLDGESLESYYSRPNGEALRKCILRGLYKPTTVLVQAVEATDDSQAVPEHTTVETPTNMSPKNKAHFLAEKEAIHLILTGIRDDIYSTVDACQMAQEMWEAIERLQQVNELRVEKLAKNANPLGLVATAPASQDQYCQSSRSHRSSAPLPKPSIPSRSHTSTRHKGKEIAKPITPPSET
nr:hypothetical protein [Tanacetum cinerariifolium]